MAAVVRGGNEVVAFDLMGGEKAPGAPINAAMKALRDGVRLHAFGSASAIMGLQRSGNFQNLTVTECREVIGDSESPLRAVREKVDSSIHQGLLAVRDGRAGAFVSAGSTGALVAGGVVLLGRAPGIDKPCLGQVLPTLDGRGTFFVDLGASADARPQTLLQFAILGRVYAEHVLGWENLRVGLLSTGPEAEKGNMLVRKANALLRSSLPGFVGNVEARDVFTGQAHVVVADGFTGNVFLKACEGAAELLFSSLKKEVTATALRKAASGALRPVFSAVKGLLDYTAYGGAPLLGLNGCVIKCHGAAGEEALANGIGQALAFLKKDVAAIITRSISDTAVGGEE